MEQTPNQETPVEEQLPKKLRLLKVCSKHPKKTPIIKQAKTTTINTKKPTIKPTKRKRIKQNAPCLTNQFLVALSPL